MSTETRIMYCQLLQWTRKCRDVFYSWAAVRWNKIRSEVRSTTRSSEPTWERDSYWTTSLLSRRRSRRLVGIGQLLMTTNRKNVRVLTPLEKYNIFEGFSMTVLCLHFKLEQMRKYKNPKIIVPFNLIVNVFICAQNLHFIVLF